MELLSGLFIGAINFLAASAMAGLSFFGVGTFSNTTTEFSPAVEPPAVAETVVLPNANVYELAAQVATSSPAVTLFDSSSDVSELSTWSEAEFLQFLNARFTGLLSHTRWLINDSDRVEVVLDRESTSRTFFDKQIERTTDNLSDSIKDSNDELEEDLSTLDARLVTAEGTIANLSLSAASTSVMAANLTLNGYWLSGDGDDEGVFVDADGSVGIGTTTVSANSALTVEGRVSLAPIGNGASTLRHSETTGYLQVQGGTLSSNGAGVYLAGNDFLGVPTLGAGDVGFVLGTTTSRFRFQRAGSELLSILNSGNVGIGTSTPTRPFVVSAEAADGLASFTGSGAYSYTSFIQSAATTSEFRIWPHNNGNIYLQHDRDIHFTGIDSPASRLTISALGNVGIGNASPSSALSIQRNTNGVEGVLVSNTSSGATASSRLTLSSYSAVEGGQPSYIDWSTWNSQLRFVAGRNNLGQLQFSTITGGSEQVRVAITNAGNVGIGTTTPNNLLQVYDLIEFDNTDFATNLGYQSGKNSVSGAQYNTYLGYQSGYASSTGSTNAADYNSAVGYRALYSNVSGAYNTANGAQSLYSNTIGNSNTANGRTSLFSNTTGNYNSAVGLDSLRSNTTGSNNTANGAQSIYFNTIGSGNTAVGNGSLYSNTTGSNNTAIGYLALNYNTGSNNTALGYIAGRYLIDGLSAASTTDTSVFLGAATKALTDSDQNSIVIGYNANGLGSNTVVLGNDSITATALKGNVGIGTTTPNNLLQVYDLIEFDNTNSLTQIGYQAGKNLVPSAQYNTFVGYQAGLSSSTAGTNAADYNTGIGYMSLFSNTTGSSNTANGYQALYSNTEGTGNTANGNQALRFNTTGINNTANGNQALYSNTTGGQNTANGYRALYFNTTGNENTANGYRALYSNTTGIDNTANGYQALYSNTTGTGNTASGYLSILSNTTGTNNTAFGYQAGRYLTDGTSAASTTDYSLFLGADTKALTADDQNSIIIGYNANGLGSNTVVLGNDSIVTTVLKGNVGIGTTTPSEMLTVAGTIQSTSLLGGSTNLTTDASGNIIRDPSDARLKENVTTIENALETVLGLRGVRYEWIDKERFGDQFEIGFIAQEVDELVPEVVQKGGEYWSLNSKNLVAVVVEAVKEIWAKVLGHEERLNELEAENAALKARLEAVEAEMDVEVPSSSPTEVVETVPEETPAEVPSTDEVTEGGSVEEVVDTEESTEPILEEVVEEAVEEEMVVEEVEEPEPVQAETPDPVVTPPAPVEGE